MIDTKRLNDALKYAFMHKQIYKKKDMAQYLGYDYPYFSSITSGREKVSEPFLNKISDILGINLDWIATGEGNILKERISQANSIGDNNEIQNCVVELNNNNGLKEEIASKMGELKQFYAMIGRKDEQIIKLIDKAKEENKMIVDLFNTNDERFIELLKKKDEQIDRFLSIIESFSLRKTE